MARLPDPLDTLAPDAKRIYDKISAKRGAMRQIECELRECHEALARELCGWSWLGAFLWRGGSGAGAGS